MLSGECAYTGWCKHLLGPPVLIAISRKLSSTIRPRLISIIGSKYNMKEPDTLVEFVPTKKMDIFLLVHNQVITQCNMLLLYYNKKNWFQTVIFSHSLYCSNVLAHRATGSSQHDPKRVLQHYIKLKSLNINKMKWLNKKIKYSCGTHYVKKNKWNYKISKLGKQSPQFTKNKISYVVLTL